MEDHMIIKFPCPLTATVRVILANPQHKHIDPIVALYTTAASSYAAYPVIQQAGLMILTHLYNNRSDTTSTNLKQIPMGAAALLRPYKPLVL